jgi:hypothetical protein
MTTEGHEQRQACSTSGTKTTLVEQAAFQVFRRSRTREMIPVPSAGGRQAFSVVEIWDFAKAGGESRFYFRGDIWKLADISFEIGAPNNQTRRILQSTDAG